MSDRGQGRSRTLPPVEGSAALERTYGLPSSMPTGSFELDGTLDVRDSTTRSSLEATHAVTNSAVGAALGALSGSSRERYEIRGELGRGQQGVVMLAFDRVLEREVALKIARLDEDAVDDEAIARFVREARTMAQIAHPNVVPVYDAGVLPNGRLFFSMPVLPHRTFKEVLDERGATNDDAEHALVRLLRSFSSVCMAIQAAHDHGVVHRDLKPANLVYGTRGEILVGDFGLARLLVEGDTELALMTDTVTGHAIGTPLYMSPEQARGSRDVGPASDIYALGVILYEILTGGLPIVRRSFVEQILAVMEAEPAPPVAQRVGLVVPPDLGALALRCLAKAPGDRPESARALVDEVDAWLEGRHERERRREEVAQLVKRAKACLAATAGDRATLAGELRAARESLAAMPEHAEIERKIPVWEALDAVEARAFELRRKEDEAIVLLESALMVDSSSAEVRALLAQIHLARMARHEDKRDHEGAADEARRATLADPETTARALSRPSLVRVVLSGASHFDLELYVERHRVLVPTLVHRGVASGERLELQPGSYRVRARSPGGTTVVLPLFCRRGAEIEVGLDVRPADRAPAGFVYVPPGPAMLGGDAESLHSEPARESSVAGFFIMRDPISCRAYASFLEDLARRDGDAALEYAPRVSNDATPYWTLSGGRIVLPERDEQGDSWRPDHPVLGVSALDAEAYAAWRSSLDQRHFRLPTDDEWERAGRGADGRQYPWGHHFDPAFCKMRLSRAGDPFPEAIGTFVTDVSPFGVRDLAGGVADWTASPYRNDLAHRSVRGGGWTTRAHRCSLTFRGMAAADTPIGDLGFRLVASLTG